ncbi:MAG: 4-hydroxy-3-methylbut-2-enyl diphosphate reductase [Chitinophagaceae bacterium]
MKKFDVPIIYRSPLISAIKKKRKEWDKTENNASQQGRDFAPTMLDFGPVQIYLARYFGFCYGVENAIEIAFKTVAENKGKKIYLLSEMIHNPQVNADLQAHGIQFLQDTYGKQLIPFSAIQQDDIVLIPAFGTTLLIEEKLKQKGIQTEKYNTTCPFVEKVWNRSEAIAKKNYTIVIHGKPRHEETRATFSHAANNAPSVVVKNMDEAKALAQYITGQKDETAFLEEFKNQHSIGFDIHKDLKRIGVVNQTTMLASHTQAIADYLKQVMLNTFPNDSPEEHFADTRDTLCYATNDNQTAVSNMLNTDAHLAIVVGGYNSSNTSHLVELCEAKLPTYFINNEEKILDNKTILHHNFHTKETVATQHFLPDETPVKILLTSGASCPDALVEGVINKLTGFYKTNCSVEDLIDKFQ